MDYTYDFALVALSIAMATLAAFTCLIVTAAIRHIHKYEAYLRIMLGALAMGSGIWATHFVGLTAMMLPADLEFSFIQIAASVSIIILISAAALAIVNANRFGWMTFPASSALLATGMAGMQLLGMSVLARGYDFEISWFGIVLSLIIALQVSAAILWFAFHERTVLETFLGAAALGLAISTAHYSSMEAVALIVPDHAIGLPTPPGGRYLLALPVAATIYVICGFCIGIFTLVGFIKSAAPETSHRTAG